MNDATELKALIKEAYSLFSSYSFGTNFEVCYGCCCLQLEDGKLIQTTALKRLDRRLIFEYLDAAESHDKFALAQQMKYLLPRILELLVEDQYLRHSTEITLNKCHLNEPNAWKKAEIEFMHKFALTFFKYQTLNINCTNHLGDFIIMFHIAGLNIQSLLDKWIALLQHPSALIKLATLLDYDFNDGFYNQAFAEDELKKQMNQWIQTPSIQNTILQHFTNALDDEAFSEEDKTLINSAAYQIY